MKGSLFDRSTPRPPSLFSKPQRFERIGNLAAEADDQQLGEWFARARRGEVVIDMLDCKVGGHNAMWRVRGSFLQPTLL